MPNPVGRGEGTSALSERRSGAARIGRREEHGVDRGEIALVLHALHRDAVAVLQLREAMVRARLGELLGTAVKVTDQQFPRLYEITARCAETLGIPVPSVYVSHAGGELNAHTLGTDEDSYIVVNGALVDHLAIGEQLAAQLGTVREVVARSLKELVRSGAIRLEDRSIRIADKDVLSQWTQPY